MISFGMPVMVFEDTGVKQAIQKSGDMARETWVEDISNARASLSWIYWTIGVIGLIPLVLVLFFESTVLFIVVAVLVLDFWFMLGSFCSSMNNLFAVSLYHYVNRGELPPFYSAELVETVTNELIDIYGSMLPTFSSGRTVRLDRYLGVAIVRDYEKEWGDRGWPPLFVGPVWLLAFDVELLLDFFGHALAEAAGSG